MPSPTFALTFHQEGKQFGISSYSVSVLLGGEFELKNQK